jgi:hypothetical protein
MPRPFESVEAELRQVAGQISQTLTRIDAVANWLLANASNLENAHEQDRPEVPHFLAFFIGELMAAKSLMVEAQSKVLFVTQPFASDEKNRNRRWGLRLREDDSEQ